MKVAVGAGVVRSGIEPSLLRRVGLRRREGVIEVQPADPAPLPQRPCPTALTVSLTP